MICRPFQLHSQALSGLQRLAGAQTWWQCIPGRHHFPTYADDRGGYGERELLHLKLFTQFSRVAGVSATELHQGPSWHFHPSVCGVCIISQCCLCVLHFTLHKMEVFLICVCKSLKCPKMSEIYVFFFYFKTRNGYNYSQRHLATKSQICLILNDVKAVFAYCLGKHYWCVETFIGLRK